MARVKQYRIRLTEEEDALLKQKAKDLGLTVADIIRLGIRSYVGDKEFATLTERRFNELKSNSQFIQNWEQTFEQSVLQEFGKKWLDKLQFAYLHLLAEYKDYVDYVDGKFVSSVIETEEGSDTLAVVQETLPETISDQKVREGICYSLKRFLGGEWKGDEWIIHTFLTGLKVDKST